MKKYKHFLFAFLPVALILFAGFARDHTSERRKFGDKRSNSFDSGGLPSSSTGFAVVELFTSEGCSSCPPADKALMNLAREFPHQVYVLGFHVDYWDRLGWKDSYSTAGYTQRQKEYAAQFKLESVYTPEAVVNGRKEFVGSDEGRLESAVKDELVSSINNRLALVANSSENGKIYVRFNLSAAGINREASLHVALVQSHASSQVLRGENQGLQLQHINVVRDFQTTRLEEGIEGKVELSLPSGLSPNDCKVIGYIQNKDGLVVGAEMIAVTKMQ